MSAVRIAWASPYATTYQVEYWVGKDALDFDRGPAGRMEDLSLGRDEERARRHGHAETRRCSGLDAVPARADDRILEHLRSAWIGRRSQLCWIRHSGNPRGQLDASGAFVEVRKHAASEQQHDLLRRPPSIPGTPPTDVNASGSYQHTGFDLFFTSGLTNNLPAMIPVTMLYGTPDDAAAQIAYIEKRGYPIAYIEMGEEPDGKHAMPEDYGALYIQWATAIHKVDPKLKLGGPIFEGVNEDIRVWPDAQGRTSWMGRFVDYLKAHGRHADLAFVSFEHYPFEPCDITWKTSLHRAAADEAHPAGVAEMTACRKMCR